MNLPDEKRQAIREAVFDGRTIEAIKLVRETAGCDLKDAKDFVDRLAADLREQEPEKFRKPAGRGGGCLGVVAGMVLVGVMVVIVWTRIL